MAGSEDGAVSTSTQRVNRAATAASAASRSQQVGAAIRAGLDAQGRGDLTTAEAAYRDVLDVDPNEPQAVQLLGAILVDRGEFETAVELFESARDRAGEP